MRLLNKVIVIAALFLFVIAVGVFSSTDLGKQYFAWLKASMSQIVGNIAEAPGEKQNIPENSNFSAIDLNKNTDNKSDVSEQKNTAKVSISTEDIGQEIDSISEKISEIKKEVEKITVLNDIESQVNQIAVKTNQIGQEVNSFRTLSDVQQQVNLLSQAANLLSQQVQLLA